MTLLFPAPFPRLRKPSSTALVLATSMCACPAVLAQPALLQTAADMDWVPMDQLTAAQKARIPEACCGLYVDKPIPPLEGKPNDLQVTGKSLEGSTADGVTEMNGALHIQRGSALLTADHGINNEYSQVLTLSSNITYRQKGMLLIGENAKVDRIAGSSEISNASYLLHDSSVRGTAAVIVYKDDSGIITIDNGVFTRCEPGDNSWQIKGEKIVLDREAGTGTARDVTIRIKDVPVMYLPWVSFPIDDHRESGFLAPVLGSTRYGGIDVATPYYFNLAPNYDLTLTPRLQTERGVMLGAEARYLGTNFKEQLDGEYLTGDKRYDPNNLFQAGSPPTPTRWSTKYTLSGNFAPGWSAGINYRAVSDLDFFRDFGKDGLNSTTQSFLYRNASINYRDQHWAFSVATENVQLLDPTVSPVNAPYSTLPRIKLDGFYWLPSGVQYGISSEYTVFDRNPVLSRLSAADIANGALVTGSRLALTPEISLPLSTAYSFFTPTIKYKYAQWSLSDQAAGQNSSPSRGILSANIDTGLVFERDFSLSGTHYRQTLEPRLYYLYNQYKDQGNIPLFDTSALTFSFNQLFRDDRFSGKDRVGDADQMTYAVTSRLFNDKGQEKAAISVGRIQYFEDRRVTLTGPPTPDAALLQSALTGEMSYQLADHWRTSSYAEWNTHDNQFDVGNVQLQYQGDANHLVNLAWRYRDVPEPRFINGIDRRIKQSDVSAIWPIVANWNLVARWNYDYSNKRTLEGIAGLEYSNCCWRVRLVARSWIDSKTLLLGQQYNNNGVFVQFELKGLGSILGGNINSILNNGISGFQDRNNGIN